MSILLPRKDIVKETRESKWTVQQHVEILFFVAEILTFL